MFLLPNNKKIDEDGVIDAMLDTDTTHRYFLDLNTGEVGCVEKEKEAKEKPLDPKRYIAIPKISPTTQLAWMKDFVESCVDVPDLVEALMEEMHSNQSAKKAFKQCIKLLSDDESGWILGWPDWQGTPVFDEMLKWFSTLPFELEERFEGCGDCELCNLMEQGNHTIGDFLEAKQKEERKKKQSK